MLRIGELSRRVGVSEHVLRAWESRYGLLSPVRSPGGFRLYSAGDEQRVRRMQFHLARGLRAAEAARATITEGPTPGAVLVADLRSDETGRPDLQTLAADLQTALDALDEPAAQAVLDRLMSDFTLAATLRDVVVPYLRELGERWANGEVTIIQEHFASNVIRGRLAGLARGWGNGDGPRAVLACPPGELHDLAAADLRDHPQPSRVASGLLRSEHAGGGGDRRRASITAGPHRRGRDGAPAAHGDQCRPRPSGRGGATRPRRGRGVTSGGRRGRRRVAHRRPSHRSRAATAPTAAVSVRHAGKRPSRWSGRRLLAPREYAFQVDPREAEERPHEHDQRRTRDSRAWVERDRLHDVSDDKHFEAEQEHASRRRCRRVDAPVAHLEPRAAPRRDRRVRGIEAERARSAPQHRGATWPRRDSNSTRRNHPPRHGQLAARSAVHGPARPACRRLPESASGYPDSLNIRSSHRLSRGRVGCSARLLDDVSRRSSWTSTTR